MSVNAADYNENGTLDANATRAKAAKTLKTPNQVESVKTAKTAKSVYQVVSNRKLNFRFESR